MIQKPIQRIIVPNDGWRADAKAQVLRGGDGREEKNHDARVAKVDAATPHNPEDRYYATHPCTVQTPFHRYNKDMRGNKVLTTNNSTLPHLSSL